MLKRYQPYIIIISESNQLQHELAEWIFQSHNWVEDNSGHFHYEFCKITKISNIITSNDELCPKNPVVIRLKENIINKIKGVKHARNKNKIGKAKGKSGKEDH